MDSGVVAFQVLNEIYMKALLIVIIVLSQVKSLAQNKEVGIQNVNLQNMINFSDSTVIENPVVINFFKGYLDHFKETPIVVCHISNYNDSLSLTLAGYSDLKSIYGIPIGFIKVEDRFILMDFGIKQLITKGVSNDIISKLNLSPTLQGITENRLITYTFASWQLILYKDGCYTIHEGVMPPGSPPSMKSSDTTKIFYRAPTH